MNTRSWKVVFSIISIVMGVIICNRFAQLNILGQDLVIPTDFGQPELNLGKGHDVQILSGYLFLMGILLISVYKMYKDNHFFGVDRPKQWVKLISIISMWLIVGFILAIIYHLAVLNFQPTSSSYVPHLAMIVIKPTAKGMGDFYLAAVFIAVIAIILAAVWYRSERYRPLSLFILLLAALMIAYIMIAGIVHTELNSSLPFLI